MSDTGRAFPPRTLSELNLKTHRRPQWLAAAILSASGRWAREMAAFSISPSNVTAKPESRLARHMERGPWWTEKPASVGMMAGMMPFAKWERHTRSGLMNRADHSTIRPRTLPPPGTQSRDRFSRSLHKSLDGRNEPAPLG